jgi:hypothetical protein
MLPICTLAFTMRSEASRKLLRLNIFSVLTLNQADHGEGSERFRTSKNLSLLYNKLRENSLAEHLPSNI